MLCLLKLEKVKVTVRESNLLKLTWLMQTAGIGSRTPFKGIAAT